MNTHEHFLFPIAKVLIFLTFVISYGINAQRYPDEKQRVTEKEIEYDRQNGRATEYDRQNGREIESDRHRDRQKLTNEDKYYITIKHPVTGLVLDASEEEVKLQLYNQTDDAQFWKLEATIDGKFIILNKSNNQALDVKNGVSMGASVITYGMHGLENQQFYINSDGSIVSTVNKLAVEIKDNNFSVGSGLLVNSKVHGSPKQRFSVEVVQFA